MNSTEPTITDFAILQRALAAHFRRRAIGAESVDLPAEGESEVREIAGLRYAIVRNNYRTLAVYRWLPRAQLKRLKRWPEALNTLGA